jgi:hypothetical protein
MECDQERETTDPSVRFSMGSYYTTHLMTFYQDICIASPAIIISKSFGRGILVIYYKKKFTIVRANQPRLWALHKFTLLIHRRIATQ